MTLPRIALVRGGISAEREVSLVSGQAVAAALSDLFPGRVDDLVLDRAGLPPGLDPSTHVVFSVLHGTFGEDGQFQRLLEEAGCAYAGCDVESSRLCMHKQETKDRVAAAGVRVAPGLCLEAGSAPSAREIVDRLGPRVVLKPEAEGSSVGLAMTDDPALLAEALAGLPPGRWLAERRLHGRELTVGLLDGAALGIVEIVPRGGVYDYRHKYTPGNTEYRFPAELPPGVEAEVAAFAEHAFAACGCRDFARIDFILEPDQRAWFLEINTLPGMTPTSLLPKSASCRGLDFPALVRRMVTPALGRYQTTHPLS